jgi:hypothetical protein
MAQELSCSQSKLTPRSGIVRPQQLRPTRKPAYRRERQKFGGSPFAGWPTWAGWVRMEQRARDELLRAIDRWRTGAHEPTLDEVLADPGIQRLMARDGVDEATVRRLAHDVGDRFRRSGSRTRSGTVCK